MGARAWTQATIKREIRTARSGKSAANITIHPLEGRRSDRMRQADYLITANP